MNVLLLRPAPTRRSILEINFVQEPISALVIAPSLAERHDVRVVDARFERDVRRALGDFRPRAALVGVGPLTHGRLDATLSELREHFPGIRVLLYPEAEYGNDHVALRPQDYQHPLADVLSVRHYLNDQRWQMRAVVDAWEEGDEVTGVPGLWVHEGRDGWTPTADGPSAAGDYGVPDRRFLGRSRGKYLFNGMRDTAFVFTAFGCKFKCRYCTMSTWNGSIFERAVSDVVAELLSLRERRVFFGDFEPLLAPGHMARIADAVESDGIDKKFYFMTRADSALEHTHLIRRWQALGLDWIYLGLDGHSMERLRELRKGSTPDVNEEALRALQSLGLNVAVGFTVRSDFTHEDFAELRTYVSRLRPPLVGFTVETPLVGTRLFEDEESRITTRDWSLFDLQHAVLPTSMSLPAFYREMYRLLMLSGRLSLPKIIGAYPARDSLRALVLGAQRVNGLLFAASHHRGSRSVPTGWSSRSTRRPTTALRP